MTKTSRYALITALTMFLAGYVGQREPAPIEEAKSAPEQPVELQQPVPTVPSVPTIPQQPGPVEYEDQTAPPASYIRHYDWNGVMQPMVSKMLRADDVTAGSVLLVDSINSRTNGSSNATKATETLRNALANNGRFTLVSAQRLSMAKQQLGLSPQDSSGTRSKAIGIAHNVGAHHVLYSSASGNVDAPTLQM